MYEKERKIHVLTEEEEAEVQRHIAEDPDAPEWTEEDWANARPAIEVHPQLVALSLRRRVKEEGLKKTNVTVQLDADVVAHFLESGKGWQTRLNDALRRVINS